LYFNRLSADLLTEDILSCLQFFLLLKEGGALIEVEIAQVTGKPPNSYIGK